MPIQSDPRHLEIYIVVCFYLIKLTGGFAALTLADCTMETVLLLWQSFLRCVSIGNGQAVPALLELLVLLETCELPAPIA